MTLTSERVAPTAVVFRRRFKAPPERVWNAHFSEHLVPKWMGGYEGWTMPDCSIDAREGGGFRFGFAHPEEEGFAISGTYETLDPPNRSVHHEQMHLPGFTTPLARVETVFEPHGTGTAMTMTISCDNAEDMDQMLATGMEDGMEHTYAALDRVA